MPATSAEVIMNLRMFASARRCPVPERIHALTGTRRVDVLGSTTAKISDGNARRFAVDSVAQRVVGCGAAAADTLACMAERNAPLWMTAILVVVGLLCVVAGVIYFAEPAKSLPSFFPGHLAGSGHHHTKHGIAAIVVGIVVFVGAWMTAGRRSAASS